MYIKLVVWSMKRAFITLGIQLWFFTKPRVCDATVRGNHDGRPCNRCNVHRGASHLPLPHRGRSPHRRRSSSMRILLDAGGFSLMRIGPGRPEVTPACREWPGLPWWPPGFVRGEYRGGRGFGSIRYVRTMHRGLVLSIFRVFYVMVFGRCRNENCLSIF